MLRSGFIEKYQVIPKYCILFYVCFYMPIHIHAQVGKVGINTTSPAAMLHVKDSSVVFSAVFPPSLSGMPPVSGSGVRMMWHPNKASLRAGGVSGPFWNNDSIGIYSIAFGFNSKAKGNYSAATGNSSTANGASSISFGNGTTAIGDYSVAMGYQTAALGEGSIALGYESTASNLYSTSIGFNTLASGIFSTAMGADATAAGNASTALGANTLASGFGSTATGNYTIALGTSSIAMGSSTKASGNNSIAGGLNTIAHSYGSFVIGKYNDTTAASSVSWILTDPLFIIGDGLNNTSRSNMMTVLKNGNVGIGPDATPSYKLHVTHHVGGSDTWQKGIMVENTGITPGEAAISFRNTAIPSSRQWNIGCNQSPALSLNYGNQFVGGSTFMHIDTNGNTGVGTTTPDARLHVSKGTGGGVYSSSSALIIEDDATSYIQFSNPNNTQCGILSGNSLNAVRSSILFFADSSITFRAGGDNTRLTIEKNGTVGIGTVSPDYLLEVNGSAGKPTTNTWTVSSDARLKKDVHDYEEGLDELLKIHPVWFTYTGEAGLPKETGVGVLAQELQEIAPYMVGTRLYKDDQETTTSYLTVNNGPMTYMLINAVKEQQHAIEEQAAELHSQRNEINMLKNEIAQLKIILDKVNHQHDKL
jgi:hypothetical protein